MRISYNGDFTDWKKNKHKIDVIMNNDDINEVEMNLDWNGLSFAKQQEVDEILKEKYKFIYDYKHMYKHVCSLVDSDPNAHISKMIVWQREVIDVRYTFRWIEQIILQFNRYRGEAMFNFWFWCMKMTGVFWRLLEVDEIFKCRYDSVNTLVYYSSSDYLNRIDFYYDYNGTLKEFINTSEIRGFRDWNILKWCCIKKGWYMQIKEWSTIYFGDGTNKSKRVVARLYNKWNDTIAKKKLSLYKYICEKTKRFEIEIENREIRDQKKLFKWSTIKDFIGFLYENVVKKKYNKKGTEYARFDVSFIKKSEIKTIKKINFEKNKNNKTKINHYFAYTKTMLRELTPEIYQW